MSIKSNSSLIRYGEKIGEQAATIERLTEDHGDMNVQNVKDEKTIERLTAESEGFKSDWVKAMHRVEALTAVKDAAQSYIDANEAEFYAEIDSAYKTMEEALASVDKGDTNV